MTKQEKSTTRDAVKLRAQAERGRHAEALEKDYLIVEMFDNLEKQIEKAWKDSAAGDQEARDNAYRLHRLVRTWRSNLKAILVNGNNAKVLLQLEEIKGGTAET